MAKVVIIGTGGVATVGAVKCAELPEIFDTIIIASHHFEKCEALVQKIQPHTKATLIPAYVDAGNLEEMKGLFDQYHPDLVLHLGLPYHNLTIMEACVEKKVHYIDTAAAEPENVNDPEFQKYYQKRCQEKGFYAYFDYPFQWAFFDRFQKAGVTAILGCGFDPGATQAYVAYAKKHEFDTIDTVDILDCNGGSNGYPFATNFNPEINLREVSSPAAYWENHTFHRVDPMSIKEEYDFDGVGKRDIYLLYHEEMESLGKNFPEIKRMRFWMTFSKSYLDHMRCLEDVGMLSPKAISFEGHSIVPIQFLKALLPDPATLGSKTVGKTNIGCIFTGKKDGKEKHYYLYNICDHQAAYRETGTQGVSYTAGVPAVCGAIMLLTKKWDKAGVYNVEEMNPDPFLQAMSENGLPFQESYDPEMVK